MAAADIAAAQVQQIIDNAIDIANQMAAASTSAGNQAIEATNGIFFANPIPVQFNRPSVWAPAELDQLPNLSVLQGDVRQIGDYYTGKLVGMFNDAFNTLFDGQNDAYPTATAWLMKAMAVGGTGLSADYEARVAMRDRQRVQGDTDAKVGDTIRASAGRGWKLPTGSASAAITRLRQTAQDAFSAGSNTLAIKVMEEELTNVRLAVSKAQELRTTAWTACLDYMRAQMLGPELGLKMSLSTAELRKSFIDAHLGWQNASLNAAQMDLQAKIANSSNDAHLASANISGFAHIMQARATAAAAAAQAAGHQGAAALSSLSSGAHLNVSASQ